MRRTSRRLRSNSRRRVSLRRNPSPRDEKDYKTAVSRLAIAEKASRAVPVAKAERLRLDTRELDSKLSREFIAAEKARAGSSHYARPDADDLVKLERYYAEIGPSLKMLSRIALREGDSDRKLAREARALDRLSLDSHRHLSGALALAHLVSGAAHYVAMKARRADEMKTFYGRWIEFYKTNGRTPTFWEQRAFVP